MSNKLEIVTVPKDLYYHEVAYVRGLEQERDELRAALEDANRLYISDRIIQLERERDVLREALTIANDDAQKLALRLEGESNLVAELSRRLAALEAKPWSDPIDMQEPLGGCKAMPNPTPEMLDSDPLFDAIWSAIKTWDVNVPASYGGYCGANGSHAALIYIAVKAALEAKP